MPEREYLTLSKRIVDRLAVDGKDAVFWDRGLPGFGVRVYPSGRKVYVVQTRANVYAQEQCDATAGAGGKPHSERSARRTASSGMGGIVRRSIVHRRLEGCRHI